VVIQVNVALRPGVAPELDRDDPATPEARELVAEASRLGVTLEPVHPGATDARLASHFVAAVADEEAAERVRATLGALRGVDGAWIKPPDEPPG
jgi:hypothetical protein